MILGGLLNWTICISRKKKKKRGNREEA
jgi:hypothetical protein